MFYLKKKMKECEWYKFNINKTGEKLHFTQKNKYNFFYLEVIVPSFHNSHVRKRVEIFKEKSQIKKNPKFKKFHIFFMNHENTTCFVSVYVVTKINFE